MNWSKPTEQFGFEASPAFSYEVIVKGVAKKKHLLPRIGIGILKFDQRPGRQPAYLSYTNSYPQIVPADLSNVVYRCWYVNFGLDFKVKVKNWFDLYFGPGVNVGHLKGSKTLTSTNGTKTYYFNGDFHGFCGRIGAEYLIKKKFAVFIEAKRNYNKVEDGGNINYNDYSLGFRIKVTK